MSWSPCECVTADVTHGEHRRTRFSLAANHCSASRNQPPKPAVHRALKHHPPKHSPIPPWMHEKKKKKISFSPPAPPRPLSINQTPKSGGGKGKEEECNNSAPPHHCVATKRRSAARLLATAGKLKCHRKVTLPPTKKDDYHQINK